MKLILLGLMMGIVVFLVGCSTETASVSKTEAKAILMQAERFLCAVNTGDVQGVQAMLWRRSVSAKSIRLARQRKLSLTHIQPQQDKQFRLVTEQHGVSGRISIAQITSSDDAGKTVLLQAGPPDDSAWDSDVQAGRISCRLVLLPVMADNKEYLLPFVEVTTGKWVAVCLPDSFQREDVPGIDERQWTSVPWDAVK